MRSCRTSSVTGPLLPAHAKTESEINSANRRTLGFIGTCHCTPVERVEKHRFLVPVGLNLHMELQKDLHPEEPLQLLAGIGSDLFQHRPARPYDDAFLTVALHVNGGVDARDIRLFIPLVH